MNTYKRYFKNRILYILFLLISITVYSCGAQIRSFTVEPLTKTAEDSLIIKWDVSGDATLLYREKPVPGDSASKYLEFTLVVQKGGKEINRLIQVKVLPGVSTDEIVFPAILSGDTLIASGEKNILRWGNMFRILSVSSASERQIIVNHSNIKVELDKEGTPNNGLEGTPVEGFWEFRSLLTDTEKNDLSNAPEKLKIKTIIQYKRR